MKFQLKIQPFQTETAVIQGKWVTGKQAEIKHQVKHKDKHKVEMNGVRNNNQLPIAIGDVTAQKEQSPSAQFNSIFPIRYALRSELSWTHYRMFFACAPSGLETVVAFVPLCEKEKNRS